MYALPISDTRAVAVDDADADRWGVHMVDFAARTIESFSVTGLGSVSFAHFDKGRELLWVTSDGVIFAIQFSKQEIFQIDGPDEDFFVYTMIGEGSHVYVGGEYSNLWRIALPSLEWEPLSTPAAKPPRSEDPKEQTRRVRDYARRHPPFYASFEYKGDVVFCGALGALARVRGTKVERFDIETGARLVAGRAEGTGMSLSADSPGGEIYVGSFDDGFELLFTDTLRALNRTALYRGQRYVGVAEYPPSDVHVLYIRENAELVPIETGTAREPVELISLTTTGAALWAIDSAGIFRLADGAWTLVDLDDLRRGTWPEDG